MIILDTNILISALIKDSTTRRIIIESSFQFFYPEISLQEIRKYEKYILKKSGYSKLLYVRILNKLLEYINLVPTKVITSQLSKAKKIMANIDIKDTVFIATALALNNATIWSDDKDFDKQKTVKILKTKDMVKLFEN